MELAGRPRSRHDVRDLHQLVTADESARLDRSVFAKRIFIDGVGRDVADEERVSVGGRLRDHLRAMLPSRRDGSSTRSSARGTGELDTDDAGDDVVAPPGALGDDHLHGR